MRVTGIGQALAKPGILTVLGRVFIAVAFVGMGIQQWMFKGFLIGLELVPRHIPHHAFFAYLVAAVLIVGGVLILIQKNYRAAALVLTQVFFLALVTRRLPGISVVVSDLSERTVLFETLSLGAGCMMLAATLHDGESASAKAVRASGYAGNVGRLMFALSMVVFGWTHLLIPEFVAALVPSWIPFHLFWTYVTAIGFIAGGVALGLNRLGLNRLGLSRTVRPAASLLGTMFLVWVLTLHGPRVAHAPYNADEWNSAFVALAISGISFAISDARFGDREEEEHCGATAVNLLDEFNPALLHRKN
jgi:uncharacterized membrane protein